MAHERSVPIKIQMLAASRFTAHFHAIRDFYRCPTTRALVGIEVVLALRKLEYRLVVLVKARLTKPGAAVLFRLACLIAHIGKGAWPDRSKLVALLLSLKVLVTAQRFLQGSIFLIQHENLLLKVQGDLLKLKHSLSCRRDFCRLLTAEAAQGFHHFGQLAEHPCRRAEFREYFHRHI
jgi:hypothetical protein